MNPNETGPILAHSPLQQISQYFWMKSQLLLATPTSEAYSHYQSIGSSLSTHPIVAELREELMKLRDQADPHHLFYVVGGPSGIGKTQLPFALSAGDDEVKICHLLMTTGDTSSSQEIYKCLMDKSLILNHCLREDLAKNPGMSLCSGYLGVSFLPLWTVGFLSTLMGKRIEASTSFTTFHLQMIVSRMDPEDRPIFFLDEALAHLHTGGTISAASEEAKKLEYLRNLLCAVGLVVVLMGPNMGTKSCVANMAPICQGSRGGGEGVWCKLITILPRPTELDTGYSISTDLCR